MRYIINFVKTKRYYVIVFIQIILNIILGVTLNSSWTRANDVNKTYSNCTANNIAYDQYHESEDSFANFEYNVVVSQTNVEGEAINAFVYQYLRDVRYSDKTIINPNNVIIGEYCILNKNEAAIPMSISSQYLLNIGDIIYVDSIACNIKFIYNNIYQIFDVNYSNYQTVIFTGIDTLSVNECNDYCNFNPGDTVHQSMVNLNKIRRTIKNELLLINLGISSFAIIFCFFTFKLKNKYEILAFKNYQYAGGRHIFLLMLSIELSILIPTLLLTFILYLILGINVLMLINISLIYLLMYLIDLLYAFMKVRR